MDKVTDNFFKDFPARMSDGRFITNYSPNCQQNLIYQNNMTSWQYRAYLTKMANQIRNHERIKNEKLYGCDVCYEQVCNENGCTMKEVNPEGIGMKQVN